MLIKSLELNNFFRVNNKVEIKFSTDQDKNVTVIKGENGMGKTTMLSAFHWAFYGKVVLPLTKEEMLNKRTRAEMNIGDLRIASVTVEFEDKGNQYAFQRSQSFKKDPTGKVYLAGDPELLIINKTQNQSISDQKFFDNFIPEELSGFFFFDGERIDRLAKIDGKKEIKKAILDILGLTSLEQINDNLEAVKKDFNSDMKKKAKNRGLQELSEEFEKFSAELEIQIEEKNTAIEKLEKAKEIKIACDKYLQDHNADKIRDLNSQRSILESELSAIEGENGLKKQAEKSIMNHVSKNFKVYLLSQYFKQIHEFLEEKRKKRELPSDIKETFVRDLLDGRMCICGRPVNDGSPEHENLSRLLLTAGREELDSSYVKISSFINSNSTRDTIENFYPEIYKYKDSVFKMDERIEAIKKELKVISNDLKNTDDELISAKEALREKAEEDIEDATKKLGLAEGLIKKYSDELRILTGKIHKARGLDQEADLFAKCFEMADELLQLNSEIREHFIKATQEDMDIKLKSVFGTLSRKQDREPILTKDFELKIVNKHNQAPQILSTGEGQITSLAFIGALVSYAKEKPNMQLISDFAGGDYPIVMDSPFGNLDPTHKSNVTNGIPTLASQVIVILSNGQWKGEVETNLFKRVGKMYEMSDGYTDIPDSEYTVISEVN